MSATPTGGSQPPSGTTTPSRFTNQSETLEDALKTQTVGLVHLSEFKKRRVELAEQRDREAAEASHGSSAAGGSGGGGSAGGSGSREGSEAPEKPARKKRKPVGLARGKLSFAADEEEDVEDSSSAAHSRRSTPGRGNTPELESVEVVGPGFGNNGDGGGKKKKEEGSVGALEKKRKKVNPNLKQPPPKALTKSTLLREAQERETLRREFLALQERIKNEDIVIPFVFYDGTNVAPSDYEGVKVKKGEAVWLFLERARRMSGRREWLRVSVDDLLFVRGEVIIPHHYEFYYFIVNRTLGPNGLLFDYPSPLDPPAATTTNNGTGSKPKTEQGGKEDPAMTKVVDRRWYERNKHIFPASVWTEFDPAVDYRGMVRRDMGGNAFFFG